MRIGPIELAMGRKEELIVSVVVSGRLRDI